ncbi:acyltransferase [Tessaracoccus sp. OS52]|uniref:acyltransferase family protein n=1 Tax=Tessaracoccus sp. OS52 TaxID=2886691 RepID=UPI001D0FDADD|nr:acyltransferase [Tessaracoccus sp. OS52]
MEDRQVVAVEKRRNHTIDVARATSVLIVVVFHGFVYQGAITPDGLVVDQWHPPRWIFWLSWFLMAMPVFFVCGGFSHALIVDKMRARGTGYGHFLANRGRRLTGGLGIFVTFFAILGSVAAWLWSVEVAVELTSALMKLLWFISVYLVLVLFAPLLVQLHDRFGGWVLVVMMAAILVVDRSIIVDRDTGIGQLNMFLVWPLCHQLGIAYQRGWFRHGRAWRAWLTIILAALGIVVLVTRFGYPESAVGFGNMPVANHIPPTLAMALLGFAQAAVLGLVERAGWLRTLPPRVERFIARLNALMMTVYLWHVPCLLIGGGLLLVVARMVPALSGILVSQPMVVLVGIVLVLVICPLIGALEYKLIPQLGVRQDRDVAILAFLLLIAGSMLVWQFGTVLHPEAFNSAIGVIAMWVGSLTMAEASRPHGVRKDRTDSLKQGTARAGLPPKGEPGP